MDAINAHNLIILARAKGSLAEIRTLTERCEDRDVARKLYADLMNIAAKLAAKHHFEKNQRKAA